MLTENFEGGLSKQGAFREVVFLLVQLAEFEIGHHCIWVKINNLFEGALSGGGVAFIDKQLG